MRDKVARKNVDKIDPKWFLVRKRSSFKNRFGTSFLCRQLNIKTVQEPILGSISSNFGEMGMAKYAKLQVAQKNFRQFHQLIIKCQIFAKKCLQLIATSAL